VAGAAAEGFDWRSVATLGTLTLAFSPGAPSTPRATAVMALIGAADRHLGTVAELGVPYAPPGGRYGWGSNARVLANAVVLAAAADLTGDRRYVTGLLAALDHVLGRNALGRCYVTGYGSAPVTRPHHRFFARSLDIGFPPPPPGLLAGGPNSGLQDPVAAARLTGRPAQRCHLDDPESWSTNEVTIGWNAVLAVAAAQAARLT
jgi:endoglucanase